LDLAVFFQRRYGRHWQALRAWFLGLGFALTRPAKSSTCSTVSRASSASMIFHPSPRPLETPLTAQLRLSEAEADPLANTSVIEPAKLYWSD
jgi:hypothetical protein